MVVAALATSQSPAAATSYDDSPSGSWQTDGTGMVLDIDSMGTTIFVGGSFGAIRADSGSPPVAQSRLAAFDADTGAHLPGFAPELDGDVWAVEPAADGSVIYVGGTFTTVNGTARRGLAALDPATGATVAAFDAGLNNDVIDLAADGTHLYAVGRFWRAGGAQHEKVARIDQTSANVDNSWSPWALGGTATSVAVDPVLERAYIGGFFSSIDNVAGTDWLAAVSTADGSVVSGFDPDPGAEVLDVEATPTRVYVALGGIGGRVEIYETGNGARRASWFGDGDLQSVALAGDRIYVGGHHQTGLDGIGTGWLNEVDSFTDQVNPAYAPTITAAVGFGVWALHATGSDLWVGGAITGAPPADVVGFTRYPALDPGPPDVTPPTDPADLTVDHFSDVSVRLSWTAATDDSGLVGYVIERDGEPIGGATATGYVDTTVSPETAYTYTVKAVDPSSNESGFSAPVAVTTMPPLTEEITIPLGAVWAYLDSGGDPGPAWADGGFDDGAWPSGPAELGVNDGDEATVITNRLVNYFRRSFDIDVGSTVGDASIRVKRDDGIAVYINGTEVARDNLPAGPIGHTTGALNTVFGALEDEILEYPVDPALFASGSNVMAASVHNVSGSTDMSFDAELVLRLGSGPDTEPPTTPTNLTVDAVTTDTVTLSWGPSTDNVGILHYRVIRDGVRIAITSDPSVTDVGVPPGTHNYWVVAYDTSLNRSPSSDFVTVQLDSEPPTAPGNLTGQVIGDDTVTLTWDASTDNVGILHYRVYRNGVRIDLTNALSSTDSGLAPGTYSFWVYAYDPARNKSPRSNIVTLTLPPDNEPPSTPQNLTVDEVTADSVTVGWDASTDNVGILHYRVYRNGVRIEITSALGSTDSGLAPGTYQYWVVAYDLARNRSPRSATVSATVTG